MCRACRRMVSFFGFINEGLLNVRLGEGRFGMLVGGFCVVIASFC